MSSLSIQSYSQYSEDEVNELYKFSAQILQNRISNKAFCELHRVDTSGAFKMTPQEELFAKFYQGGYSQAVECSSLLEMRAKREELAKIAFEARATLTGYDKAIDEETKRGRPSQGFSRSVNDDDVSSDAINRVKTRQEKLTKGEKLLKQLMAAGMSEADAMSTLSNGNLLNQIRSKGNNQSVEELKIITPFQNTPEQQQAIDTAKAQEEIERIAAKAEKDRLKAESANSAMSFFNPFEKKE